MWQQDGKKPGTEIHTPKTRIRRYNGRNPELIGAMIGTLRIEGPSDEGDNWSMEAGDREEGLYSTGRGQNRICGSDASFSRRYRQLVIICRLDNGMMLKLEVRGDGLEARPRSSTSSPRGTRSFETVKWNYKIVFIVTLGRGANKVRVGSRRDGVYQPRREVPE